MLTQDRDHFPLGAVFEVSDFCDFRNGMMNFPSPFVKVKLSVKFLEGQFVPPLEIPVSILNEDESVFVSLD